MTEKIIVRREPKRNGGNLILFFADSYTRENRWDIDCWHSVGTNKGMGYCHGTASYEYYRDCKPVFTDYDNGEDVKKFIADYVRYVRTLPGMADYSYRRAYRLNKKK